MLLRALPLIAAFALAPATPAAAVGDIDAYRGLGTWVSIYSRTTLADPIGTAVQMRRNGVRTLYLETANWRQTVDVVRPATMAAMIEAAHAAGIKVVAWYLPSYKPLRTDVRRALAAIAFTTPTGQRFDGFALDIEASTVGPDLRRVGVIVNRQPRTQVVDATVPAQADQIDPWVADDRSSTNGGMSADHTTASEPAA